MERNENAVSGTGAEKMRDPELAKKLGHYQKTAKMTLVLGLAGVLCGIIAFFAVQDTAIKTIAVIVLFGGGLCCALFGGDAARKKLKALMQEQYGEFFRTEFEKAFGTDMPTKEMSIDRTLMEALWPPDGRWEECETEKLHEGSYRGVRFSAANARLYHVYERGTVREGKETHRDMVLNGLVVRCKTRLRASAPLRAAVRSAEAEHTLMTGCEAFDGRFCADGNEQDVSRLLTRQFAQRLIDFEKNAEGRISAICWDGGVFSMALETDYSFASVAGNVDLADADAVCRSYISSLREMEKLLDVLFENTDVFAAGE